MLCSIFNCEDFCHLWGNDSCKDFSLLSQLIATLIYFLRWSGSVLPHRDYEPGFVRKSGLCVYHLFSPPVSELNFKQKKKLRYHCSVSFDKKLFFFFFLSGFPGKRMKKSSKTSLLLFRGVEIRLRLNIWCALLAHSNLHEG